MDLQHEVRGACVAVGIGDGVGEGFRAVATAGQGFEVSIAGVQRVGVSAVGVEHQRAVGTGKSTGGDRAGGDAVGALHVIGQDVAGQRELSFRGGGCVAVVHGVWQVVDDVHIEGRVGSGAVVIDHGDGELLRQIVGAVSGCVRFVIDQGVAVTDHARRCAEPGDGQRAAQRRGDRLWEPGGDAIGDHGDTTDSQRGNAVQCGDGEGTVLR
ncbi:hypothetical protein SRM1_01451 [Pseudomonas fluorescens]|nr:hypothetical protein SRM1_01451 [Pseudomonas fluorescens]